MREDERHEILNTYRWIKVPRYRDDPSLDAEQRLTNLQRHHVEETAFLIDKIRKMITNTKHMKTNFKRTQAIITKITSIYNKVDRTNNPFNDQVDMLRGEITITFLFTKEDVAYAFKELMAKYAAEDNLDIVDLYYSIQDKKLSVTVRDTKEETTSETELIKS